MSDTWIFLVRENDWDFEDPDSRPAQAEAGQAHARFAEAVEELGAKITGGEGLSHTKYGGRVDVGGDRPVYTDAPLADSNEVITGFYAVECDEPTARRLAGLVPSGNVVEWRKVHQFG